MAAPDASVLIEQDRAAQGGAALDAAGDAAPRRWLAALALAAIVGLNVAGSDYWTAQNVVLVGHDASGHLSRSIDFWESLSPLNVQTLFHALTFTDYRPPALYAAAQPFYALLGVGMDSAQWVNIVLLACTVLVTYAIGATVSGRATGLIAALVLGLLPIMAGMARLFYTEMFTTAMVAVNLWALLKSERFARRGWAALWGISLGVGLLVKWTMPVYIWLPTLYVLLHGSPWRRAKALLQPARPQWRRLTLALAAAAVVSGLLYWPVRAQARSFPLGDWMAVGWLLLTAAVIYLAGTQSSPHSNWWLALAVGLLVASPWYLPHIDFYRELLYVGFGDYGGHEPANPLDITNYTRYFTYLYTDHLGALAFCAIVPAALVPWLWGLWRRRSIEPRATLLWLSLLSAYLVLILLAQENPRNLAPVLPALAVLAAVALRWYPPWLGVALGTAWIAVLGFQWAAVTFDGLAPAAQRLAPLLARSEYAQPPRSGATDPGYWVGPEILAAIAAQDGDAPRLAELVNTHQVHRGSLRYVAQVEGFDVELVPVTERTSRGWFDVLSATWVLLKDGRNSNVEEPGLSIVQDILAGDPFFHTLYQEAARIALPDGDTLYLYHRPEGPGHPNADPAMIEQAQSVAEAVAQAAGSRATVLFGDADAAVWVGMHGPPQGAFAVLGAGSEQAGDFLAGLEGTLLVVLTQSSAPLAAGADGDAYHALTAGGDRVWVEIFGRPTGPLEAIEAEERWGQVRLAAVESLRRLAAGDVLPLDLRFDGALPEGWKISLRLIARDGQVAASNDVPLGLDVRAGLLAPPAAAGTYTVAAVVYDAATLAPVVNGAGADQAVLFHVEIRQP